MNRSTIDLWVGVFVVAGIAGLLFLALKVGNLATFSTSQIYQVQAKFANIGGLKVRAPVKSAGVVIGRVADIRFDNETYEAIVSINIDSTFQFPRDTTAKILTSGILGEQYVGLEAGGDGVMLKNGDRLRLTQSAVVLENLISQFLFNKAAEGKPEAKDSAK
ncbi:MAG: outer membrane lipid asymmetry maintenance protein MlaD [Betaproteobacteria bacterium]|nr:outer membrane lipid asymmetry maintenance protein MlaD [Betaproteobacteria bacterium]MBV9360927.1 outer membrane lipid asymmetry maintenance protein MlaD [Betaproteobacteria bacterium]